MALGIKYHNFRQVAMLSGTSEARQKASKGGAPERVASGSGRGKGTSWAQQEAGLAGATTGESFCLRQLGAAGDCVTGLEPENAMRRESRRALGDLEKLLIGHQREKARLEKK